MKQKLMDFIDWLNELPDEYDDKFYMTEETVDRYLKSINNEPNEFRAVGNNAASSGRIRPKC